MLSPAAEDVEVLVDPFHGGEVCFLEDAADKLARVHGLKVHILLIASTVAGGMPAMSLVAIVLLLPVLCSGWVPEQKDREYCSLCLAIATLYVGMQPGKIVINPAVVRNKSANAVTPRKFLVSPVHCIYLQCCRRQLLRRRPVWTLATINFMVCM